MTFLSALRDHAWRYVASGWEEREHQDRQREREQREAAFARLAIDKVAAPAAVLAKAQDELQNSWPLKLRGGSGVGGDGGREVLRGLRAEAATGFTRKS